MKTYTTLVCIFCCLSYAVAQKPVIQWTKEFKETVYTEFACMSATSDGGIVIASILDGKLDKICLRKLDASGRLQWVKRYSETMMGFPKSIMETKDGGYFLMGNSEGINLAKQKYQNINIAVFKVNGRGDLEWEQILGTNFWDKAANCKQTADGGFIISASANVYDEHATVFKSPQEQILLIKINGNGEVQWQKEMGGPEENLANDIQLTKDGGFIIAGSYQWQPMDSNGNYLNGEPRYFDYSVIKLDSLGNEGWEKHYGTKYNDVAKSIAVCPDGGFVIAGNTGYGTGIDNAMVIKIDSTGKELWRKIIGNEGLDQMESMTLNDKAEILLAGVSISFGNQSGWLFKLDQSGDIKYNETYKGPATYAYFKDVQRTKNNCVLIGGTSDFKNPVKDSESSVQIWLLS